MYIRLVTVPGEVFLDQTHLGGRAVGTVSEYLHGGALVIERREWHHVDES